jgi:hypothetical protein
VTPFNTRARLAGPAILLAGMMTAHKVDANTLQITITVDDPRTFAKPWTSDPRTLRLQPKGSPNSEILEVIFAPVDEKEFNERVRNPAGGRGN